MIQDKVNLLNETLDGVFNIVFGLQSMDHLDDFFPKDSWSSARLWMNSVRR